MPETTSLILTLLGPDRPGLVESLASAVASQNGNWVESRMCRLGGQFAGIVRIECPTATAAPLETALRALSGRGLRIELVRESSAPPPTDGALAEIEIVGQDRPGIVHQLSAALAARAVNVEEMRSGCESAPMSGERLFRARFRVRIPKGVSVAALRTEVARVGDDLVADVTFEPGA